MSAVLDGSGGGPGGFSLRTLAPQLQSLGAPPLPAEVPMAGGMLLALLGLSLAVPVLGAILIAVLALDLVVLRSLPVLQRALS